MLDPNAVIDDLLSSHYLNYEKKDETSYLSSLKGVVNQHERFIFAVGDHKHE